MSLTAVWMTINAGTRGAGNRMPVVTPADVDALVEALSQSDATAAMIEHMSRSHTEFDGEKIPDHDMTAGVWRGYGYLSFSDSSHQYASLAGDPESPDYPAHYVEYPAGTGVSTETLAVALKEFLTTAERPTCVEWREA